MAVTLHDDYSTLRLAVAILCNWEIMCALWGTEAEEKFKDLNIVILHRRYTRVTEISKIF